MEFQNFDEHKVATDETLDSIAKQAGMTWKELSLFNWDTSRPAGINVALHQFVGCKKVTKDGKNYMFSSADEPGIVFIPKPSPEFTVPTDARHEIKVKLARMFVPTQIQTVDELGQRLPDVALILRSVDGLPDVTLTTDALGYVKDEKVRAGKYNVLRDDGTPVYFRWRMANAKDNNGKAEFGDFVEAQLDTQNFSKSVTTVVVRGTLTEEQQREAAHVRQHHLRSGKQYSIKGRTPSDGASEPVVTLRSRLRAIDNLAIAAGWSADWDEIDTKGLVSEILGSWLDDYYPTATRGGYFVAMLRPEEKCVELWSKDGAKEATFQLRVGFEPSGLIGAYAVFEDVGDNVFRDMTYRSAILDPGDQAAQPAGPGDAEHLLSMTIGLDEMVDDPAALVAAANKHPGELMVLYHLPSPTTLQWVAIDGGAGYLEDYGNNAAVNDSAHLRNRKVCANLVRAYNGYVQWYQDKVVATLNTKELRKLGPPRAPYQMPAPANSTFEQRVDLLSVQRTHELDAWKTVADQINHFYEYPSEGTPFLRIKAKTGLNVSKLYNAYKDWMRPGLPEASDKVLPVDYEIEGSLEIRKIGEHWHAITGSKQYIKANLKLEVPVKDRWEGSGKYKLEFGLKSDLSDARKWKFQTTVGPFKSELGSRGELKLQYEMIPDTVSVLSATSPIDAEFSAGFVLSFKGLAKELQKKMKDPEGVEWKTVEGKQSDYHLFLEALEKTEIEATVGFTGLYEETVLAVISHAPGFFERRDVQELLDPNVQWNDLSADEQIQLHELGWTSRTWDGKYELPDSELPASCNNLTFTAVEKVAIVHLGFKRYEEYGKRFQSERKKHVSEQPGLFFLPL